MKYSILARCLGKTLVFPLQPFKKNLLRLVYFFSLRIVEVENRVFLKGNYYWRYTKFSLNHEYGRKGINGVLDSNPLKSAHVFLSPFGEQIGLD